MLTYVFPGQGSQSKGMGESLFDEFPVITRQADEILGYSIKDLCLNDPDKNLNKTQYTQPALYVVNLLHYFKKVKETGIKPDYVAGHSLGEYSALFVAGAFDFKTGLQLVMKRGELMGQVKDGGMAAIIGMHEEEVVKVLFEKGFNSIDIANHNTSTQIVVSGLTNDISDLGKVFDNLNVTYIPLKVSGAFHSRYMKSIKDEFEVYMNQFDYEELQIPVISNANAKPYRPGELKNNLGRQLVSSVRWTDTIKYLANIEDMKFEEMGSKNVLTKLITKIIA